MREWIARQQYGGAMYVDWDGNRLCARCDGLAVTRLRPYVTGVLILDLCEECGAWIAEARSDALVRFVLDHPDWEPAGLLTERRRVKSR